MTKKSPKGSGRTVEDIQVKKYADGFNPGVDKTDDPELIRAFSLLVQARAHDQKAKELKEEAYGILGPNYLVTGMSRLYLPGVGKVSVFSANQTRTNWPRFCEILVSEYGVPAEAISATKAAVTSAKDNDKLTVKFEPEKGAGA